MEYPAFTFSVPDINIGLVSVFTVDIDLVDITQSHSVHRLSYVLPFFERMLYCLVRSWMVEFVSYENIIVFFIDFVNLFLYSLCTFFIDLLFML